MDELKKYQKLLVEKKLTLLELASELKNISKACAVVGYSRQSYYDIKERYLKEGESGLVAKSNKPGKAHPLQASKFEEKSILELVLDHPEYGYKRIADVLFTETGNLIKEGKVRGLFNRMNLNTLNDRLKYLDQEQQKKGFALTEEQIYLLSRINEVYEFRHVEAPFSGYLLSQDTFYVGHMKGVGRIYMQSVIDCSCSFGFGQLYTSKDALTSAHMLQSRVLPFYKQLDVPVLNILTDNGSEYRGTDEHPFELLLDVFSIKHRYTKVASPSTNGFVERFHRTLLNEFFQVAFRRKWYSSLEMLQSDLDDYLIIYNFKRPHRGYKLKGMTPIQVFFKNLKPRELTTVA